MKLIANKKIDWHKILLILFLQLALSTCSVVYKNTGDVLIGFAQDETVPYVLASNDVELGCAMSKAFTPFILSFSRVTAHPNELSIMLYLLAGSCSEFMAWEEDLRHLRALYSKNVPEAEDARIAQKRFMTQAARRHLAGYQSLVLAIAEPGGACPDFDSDNAELYWLLGLLDGLQAMLNDLASEGIANVPLDIASKVGRGSACLDNEKWWGLPKAIQAAIWVNIPNDKPAGVDPLNVLDQSMQIGIKQGVRVSQVLAAKVHMGLGNIEQVKSIIRSHKKAIVNTPSKPEFRLLDELATVQLLAISDHLWTEATGKRTPISGLGTFWDDPKGAVDTINIDDML
ncbi:MAG: hypothetical protein ACOYMG_15145 [Candidatus Methylumidiphilus sp.]